MISQFKPMVRAAERYGNLSQSPLSGLVSPFGTIRQVFTVPSPRGLPILSRSMALAGMNGSDPDRETVGLGSALDDPGTASTVALAEAAERYAGMAPLLSANHRWARVADLAGAVINLDRLPRCSVAEYAAPGCRLKPFDADATIRWSLGTDLVSSAPTWVPSVMALYGLRNRTPGELFWPGISTGYAVHTDPYAALCSAICEVIERDIIEILWAQRLPLPPVASRDLSAGCRMMLNWAHQHFLKIVLFDATTDMGVPTVYGLLIAEHDPRARQALTCATGVTLAAAAEKSVRDGIALRDSFDTSWRERNTIKTDVRDYTSIFDGARYMGLAENAAAYDFLLDGYQDRVPQERPELPLNSENRLRWLIDAVRGKGMQAIAVDRTTSELAAVGLTGVCVIIPDLQPMTLQPTAQFRAHPRLYRAPVLMGYRALPEVQLNPWPQPFA
jgi:ribosomal protein S12 methylthiotransferase accessory factor